MGRGRPGAKTVHRDDLVITILHDAFTRTEAVLTDGGHFEQVRENRQAFHDAAEPILREIVPALTGREVFSCLGQISGTARSRRSSCCDESAKGDPAEDDDA